MKGVEQEDMVSAFEDVRPHGRIFHDNLLRHASQVVAKVLEGFKPSALDRSVNRKVDAALRRDKKASQHRVKWRAFDDDGDSRLSDDEIRELCQALRDHPERTLFRCEGERNPATHPSYSARVLLLDAQGCFTLARVRQFRAAGVFFRALLAQNLLFFGVGGEESRCSTDQGVVGGSVGGP